MNILLPPSPCIGAFRYILNGLENAFSIVGHRVYRWDGNEHVLKQYKPDIYLGSSGWFKPFPRWARETFGTRVAYHVAPYGESLTTEPYWPPITESQSMIEKIVAQNPDFVFGYFYGELLKYWRAWRLDFGLNVVGIPTAGDHTVYKNCGIDPKYVCDLAYVGGRWDYKAINIDKYIKPLIGKYNIKIYGNAGWGNLGSSISDEDVVKLYSSTKICPCVHEPHSTLNGIDIPERIFKAPLCGAMVISDPVDSFDYYFPTDLVPMATDTLSYVTLIDHYLHHDKERIEKAALQRSYILKHHTYLNRLISIFGGFGMIDECIKVNEIIKGLLV